MSADALDRILADKRRRLDQGEFAPVSPGLSAPDGKGFVASLAKPGVRVIAEIKRRSPSAGEIVRGLEGKVESLALAYRRGHAAAISVVTEQDHFGGDPAWIARARRISGLPVLMKDFILSDRQLDFAASIQADAVLLIVRALSEAELAALAGGARDRGLAVVVEAHDAPEIVRAAAVGPDVLGVNARDLTTFATDLSSMEAMAPLIPPGPLRLAESGIRSADDVRRLARAGWQAFLVGEALLRSEDPEDVLRDLQR